MDIHARLSTRYARSNGTISSPSNQQLLCALLPLNNRRVVWSSVECRLLHPIQPARRHGLKKRPAARCRTTALAISRECVFAADTYDAVGDDVAYRVHRRSFIGNMLGCWPFVLHTHEYICAIFGHASRVVHEAMFVWDSHLYVDECILTAFYMHTF